MGRLFLWTIAICLSLSGLAWATYRAVFPDPSLDTHKLNRPPPRGVIGAESRVALADFLPEGADRFPGWEDAFAAVVRVVCNGRNAGGGVILDAETGLVLTAAHVLMTDAGELRPNRATCDVRTVTGHEGMLDVSRLRSGDFRIPGPLETHFSVPITMQDWAFAHIAPVPEGLSDLPLASLDQMRLEVGQPVLNAGGPHANLEIDGFVAQQCQYAGVPPTASDLNAEGQIVGRSHQPGDEARVARYDCDSGAGASGSPIIGWGEDGRARVWGIITDNLRGQERCLEVGRTSCYTAGPLAPAMHVSGAD